MLPDIIRGDTDNKQRCTDASEWANILIMHQLQQMYELGRHMVVSGSSEARSEARTEVTWRDNTPGAAHPPLQEAENTCMKWLGAPIPALFHLILWIPP